MKFSISGKFRLLIMVIIVFFFSLIATASIELRDSLQREFYLATQPAEKIILLNLLAESYLKDNPLKAYNYAFQARSLAETSGNLTDEAKALYYMSVSNYKQENYIVAYNLMVESQDGFDKTGDINWYAKSCLELGKIYERQFEFEKALEALLKALEIFRNMGDSTKLAEAYNIIGINYYDQKEYDKAYGNFQDAMMIRLQLKDEAGLASIYNNIGEIYRHKNELTPALEYFNKSIKINNRINRTQSLAINYDNMGNIYTLLGKFDSANLYLNESLRLSKIRKDEEMVSLSYIGKGILFRHLNKNNEALHYFDSGYQIAQTNGYLIHMQDAAYELSELYKDINQYKLAYQYHKVFKKVGDSLFDIRNQERIAQLEMKLIFEHETKINEIQQEKIRYMYFLLAFGLLSLLIIFILVYGRLRIKIKHSKIQQENLLLESQQLRKEIDIKNRELATNVMYLVKKNELINFISEKLLKAKSVFKKERQEIVQEIILELQSSIDTDIWKTFEERFRAVHKEFYQKLNDSFPLLTENDKKLCALLRLNLSTKDIAAITHQNPNSIDVARTRLRKKLNISNKEITLVSFLESI
jgi:tetratricopeptide (TPR) repeat protein/DNA-binding CsgD family transcriptional regulator